jgi:hypothetical protein
MRRFFVIALLLASLLTAGSASVSAQATPGAGVDVPDPADCTVEPRSIDSLRALFREAMAATPAAAAASPTTAVPPAGQPAAAEIVAEINATWRQFIACVNADDHLRQFAFMSDTKIRQNFVIDAGSGATEAQVVEFFGTTPDPLDPAARVPFVPFQDVRLLDGGRVAAVDPNEVLIFVKDGDRWLIDDQFDLAPNGTPTP